jgi:hypothetical protein
MQRRSDAATLRPWKFDPSPCLRMGSVEARWLESRCALLKN